MICCSKGFDFLFKIRTRLTPFFVKEMKESILKMYYRGDLNCIIYFFYEATPYCFCIKIQQRKCFVILVTGSALPVTC